MCWFGMLRKKGHSLLAACDQERRRGNAIQQQFRRRRHVVIRVNRETGSFRGFLQIRREKGCPAVAFEVA